MKMAKSTYYFELNRVDAVAEKNGVLLSEIKKSFMKIKVYMALEEFIKNFVVEATLLIIKEFNVLCM